MKIDRCEKCRDFRPHEMYIDYGANFDETLWDDESVHWSSFKAWHLFCKVFVEDNPQGRHIMPDELPVPSWCPRDDE